MDSEGLLNRFEFHRHALALLPASNDKRPGVAVFIQENRKEPGNRFCSCSLFKRKTCSHILESMELYKKLHKRFDKKTRYDDFKASVWYQIASILVEGNQTTCKEIQA
jgi:hypothetical protein